MAELINAGMRRAIKSMCTVAQIAKYIDMMPKPQDFVDRVIGDVVYISAQVKRLSESLNRLLDEYANVPFEYLQDQLSELSSLATTLSNSAMDFARMGVENTIGLAENTMQQITELSTATVDAVGMAVTSTIGLASVATQVGVAAYTEDPEMANDVKDAAEEILDWTNGKFESVTTFPKMAKATETVSKAISNPKGYEENLEEGEQLEKKGAMDVINDTSEKVNKSIQKGQEKLSALIENLRNQMIKLQQMIDGEVKKKEVGDDEEKKTKQEELVEKVNEINEEMVANQGNEAVQTVTSNVLSAFSDVIANFSLGKVVTAFMGVITQSAIIGLGLNELPKIDVDKMLNKIRDAIVGGVILAENKVYERRQRMAYQSFKDDDNKNTSLYKEFRDYVNEKNSDNDETNDVQYTAKNYKKFLRDNSEKVKKAREELRSQMKTNRTNSREAKQEAKQKAKEARKNPDNKSALRDARKLRAQANGAKIANNLKDSLMKGINEFKGNVMRRFRRIESDWNNMMNQYSKCISDMTKFLTGGGGGNQAIDRYCDSINDECNYIQERCSNITEELIYTSIKAGVPQVVGTAFDNPVYKFSDFIKDIKIIFGFIKDIIKSVMTIIQNINSLAMMMLNGLRSLKDIVKQLMELFGLKWLMDLIQSIIDLFSKKLTDDKEIFENTLSPVNFNETDVYENTMEVFEYLSDGNGVVDTTEQRSILSSAESMLKSLGDDGKKMADKVSKIRRAKKAMKDDDLEEIFDDFESFGETMVAYRSPILEKTGEKTSVSDIVDNGKDWKEDMGFIGWHYFHPDLNHTGSKYYSSKLMKKIKSKIMKRAAKTGNKANGGVRKLYKSKVGKLTSKNRTIAYNAFYWYDYYTTDIEDLGYVSDALENATFIKSSVQTNNGSIVELNDGRKVFVAESGIRSGDYVSVNGVKYRVK